MLIIDYTNHRHWLLGMSFISGCGRGDSIVLQNIVDRCTIRQIIGQKQTAEIYLLMTNIDNYYFSNHINFNLYFYYSEICLNRTLSKPKTCREQVNFQRDDDEVCFAQANLLILDFIVLAH
jgi:hypothetical protein